MKELTILSIIKLLPESNEQVLTFSENLKSVLDSGDINPLDVLLCIKGFEKVIANVKDYLNELAVIECMKYTEKDIKYKTAELQVVQTGVKYDYDNCNDYKYKSFKLKEVELKSEINAREGFLKGLKESINIIDEDSGEIVEIYPPAKTSTTTAKVTLR